MTTRYKIGMITIAWMEVMYSIQRGDDVVDGDDVDDGVVMMMLMLT